MNKKKHVMRLLFIILIFFYIKKNKIIIISGAEERPNQSILRNCISLIMMKYIVMLSICICKYLY